MKVIARFISLFIVFILFHSSLYGQQTKSTSLELNEQISQELGLDDNECFLLTSPKKPIGIEKILANRWQPTKENLKQIRNLFQAAIEKGLFDSFQMTDIKKQHFLQYIPYINNKKERVVLINAIQYNREAYNESKDEYDINYCAGMVDSNHDTQWQLFLNLSKNKYGQLFLL